MHWLVTGGAGFIGSHLSERLIAGGARVTVIDDLSTGSATNLASIRDHKSFRFHADTVMNLPLLRALVDEAAIVVHLAAAVVVLPIVQTPLPPTEPTLARTR